MCSLYNFFMNTYYDVIRAGCGFDRHVKKCLYFDDAKMDKIFLAEGI